jgi:hypothetical protein
LSLFSGITGHWKVGPGGGGEGAAPACVTVKVWPAMVRVPVRELVLLFAATL